MAGKRVGKAAGRKKTGLDVQLSDIQAAKQTLAKYLAPSPLLLNPWLSEATGAEVYLKLENMQAIGSFKIRGATYRISRLDARERKRGVIAASAGNHAQGVAWGSRQLGTSALIVMPVTAPLVKIQNTKALGAEVVLAGDDYQAAYEEARRIMRKSGRVFVPAFEHADVIAGQGTMGLEILEQLPGVDTIVGSIGGGGMMAGVAIAVKSLKPGVEIVGCQATGAPAMARSFAKGRALSTDGVETFADGIAVSKASPAMLRLLRPRLDAILEADDEAMARAVLHLLEKAKVLSEASGALPVAVLDQLRQRGAGGKGGQGLKGKKIVAIVSGGNIDVNLLGRIIDRGLIRAGRRVRLNVWVSDRPGSLARLTALLASEGANVIQAIHDRDEQSTRIGETEVALTLETKGPEHSQRLVAAMRAAGMRLEQVG